MTIGDDSYDIADSGYFVTAKHKYGKFPVGPNMHFWYDVSRTTEISTDDELTVTLDRPVYQAPTYGDVNANLIPPGLLRSRNCGSSSCAQPGAVGAPPRGSQHPQPTQIRDAPSRCVGL